MIPVNRAGSVTEMKLVSVHMATFSPLRVLSIIPRGRPVRDHWDQQGENGTASEQNGPIKLIDG